MVNEEAEAIKQQGNELLKKGNFAAAKNKYKKAIQIDPTCAVYWSNLAVCYLKLEDIIAYKEAAQKCVETDPSFLKGYYRLADAHFILYEFEEEAAVLERGLAVDPDQPDLKEMHEEAIKRLEKRAQYQEVTLSRPTEKYVPYLGGEGSGFVESKIPKDSAYGRLKRPALPPLSKKYDDLKKVNESVRNVMKTFCHGDLRVKYFINGEWDFVLEGYMPNEYSPVVFFIAKRVHEGGDNVCFYCRYGFDQNQTYHHVLTSQQKAHLSIMILQRFLRERGALLADFDEQALYMLKEIITQGIIGPCEKDKLYSDAADARLIFSDIAINHGLHIHIQVPAVGGFCEALESAKRYKEAAEIYVEIAEAKHFPRSRMCTEEQALGFAALAFKRNLDFENAELYYVASLRAAGPNGDWYNTDGITNGNLQNMMIFYEIVHRAVMSGLKKDQAHKKMQKANLHLLGLLSFAGLDCPGSSMYRNPVERRGAQSCIKNEYKTRAAAFRAVVHAVMAPTMKEYHNRLFSCSDGAIRIVDADRRNPHFDRSILQREQAALLKDQKERSKYYARKQQEKQSTAVEFKICSGCNKSTRTIAGQCPCHTVLYCSKECQVQHWPIHKRHCPNLKKK